MRDGKVILLAKLEAMLKGKNKNGKDSLLDLHKITWGWIPACMNMNAQRHLS